MQSGKLFRIVVTVLMASFLGGATSLAGINLIQNGTFDQGDAFWTEQEGDVTFWAIGTLTYVQLSENTPYPIGEEETHTSVGQLFNVDRPLVADLSFTFSLTVDSSVTPHYFDVLLDNEIRRSWLTNEGLGTMTDIAHVVFALTPRQEDYTLAFRLRGVQDNSNPEFTPWVKIDDVSCEAVPIPAPPAVLLGGIGLACASRRLRKQSGRSQAGGKRR